MGTDNSIGRATDGAPDRSGRPPISRAIRPAQPGCGGIATAKVRRRNSWRWNSHGALLHFVTINTTPAGGLLRPVVV
jgi:hypothetical protein